jgi:hypothetical protein
MAFPWIFEENFELGTKGAFDSESDSASRLDFAGPADLAADGLGVAPFRGGYVMRVNMGKSNADAYLEDDAFGLVVDADKWLRFYLMLSEDFSIGKADDVVNILGLYSAGPTFEMGIGLTRKDPEGVVLIAQQSIGNVSGAWIAFELGRWHCIEVLYQPRASSSGMSIYANGHRVSENMGVSADLTIGRIGAISQSGDFRGTMYFDQLVMDDGRVFPITEGPMDSASVDNQTMLFTKSGFAFVGSGEVLEVQAIDNGSSDARVRVYDTDTPQQIAEYDKRIDRRFDNYLPLQPTNFNRGAFVQLSGTNPQALVRVGLVTEFDFVSDWMGGALPEMAE